MEDNKRKVKDRRVLIRRGFVLNMQQGRIGFELN